MTPDGRDFTSSNDFIAQSQKIADMLDHADGNARLEHIMRYAHGYKGVKLSKHHAINLLHKLREYSNRLRPNDVANA
jgi:hypothetical protein